MDGVLTGSDVAYGFIYSDEFQAKNTSNEEYLTILYAAFFDRLPDPLGWEGWLGLLQSQGMEARTTVLDGFLGSEEFIDLCWAYGIRPTSDQSNEESFFPKIGITWRYRINDGQPITSHFEGVSVIMNLNDVELGVDPNTLIRRGSITGSISGTASGNISANFIEQLDPTNVATLGNSSALDMEMNLSAYGESIDLEIYLKTDLGSPSEWFLDRSDLDQLPIGYVYNEQGQVYGALNGYLRISGDYYYKDINDDVTSVESWKIIEKIPSYVVNGVTYQNVVVVERYTQVPSYDWPYY